VTAEPSGGGVGWAGADGAVAEQPIRTNVSAVTRTSNFSFTASYRGGSEQAPHVAAALASSLLIVSLADCLPNVAAHVVLVRDLH
jgi:hypothetical protein